MSTNTANNTAQRLRGILEILAVSAAAGDDKVGGNDVLIRVIERFPLDEQESELLAGDVPRGQKALNTGSTKLVKAGWLVKARNGWTITEAGEKALVEYPDADSFAAVLTGSAPAAKKETPKQPELPVQEPVTEAAAEVPAEISPADEAQLEEALHEESHEPAVDFGIDQPGAVAIAGSLNDWAPDAEEAQMSLDPRDQIWKLSVDLPAGQYEYKAALNRSWNENYGVDGIWDGGNIVLDHDGGQVTFHYDHRTHVAGTV